MELLEIVIGISVLMIGLYYWMTSSFDFWTSRGVPGPTPALFFGNFSDVAFGKLPIAEYLKIHYDAYRNERMFGMFVKSTPALVLIDPDLIKDVLIRDFGTFPNRGMKILEKYEPLSDNLFDLETPRWRPVRNKVALIFTLGKIKKSFNLLLECGDRLEKYLSELTSKSDVVECRELTAKFTTSVISNCICGLEVNSLTDGTNELREMGGRVFATNWTRIVKNRIRDFAPFLARLLRPVLADWKLTNFFLNIMRETIEYRKNNKIVANDLINVIMKIKDNPDGLGDIEVTDILLASQLLGIFAAGYESSAGTISNALYELAQHQNVQDKLRDDITRELAKSNGEISYEAIESMKFLHMVFEETLRLYPPGFLLTRKCSEPYTFAGTNVTIPKDTLVIVPTFAMYRDPCIFPKPDEFNPERFADEAIKSRNSMSFIPFGDGPRMCLGARFGRFQVNVALIKILQNYKVEVCDQTHIPYIIDPESSVLAPKHEIYLRMSKIN